MGTAPALSATRGKMMITSTPNGSRDLFAKLWFNSGMEWDKKSTHILEKIRLKMTSRRSSFRTGSILRRIMMNGFREKREH